MKRMQYGNVAQAMLLIAVAGAVVVFLFAFGIIGRTVDTASQMADQTVFNAPKHVYSYEEFHRKFEQYEQYKKQEAAVAVELAKLEAKGITSGQQYDNLANEKSGARNMKARIAAEYNAMSKIAYQGIWKSKGLPETLE